MAPGSAFLALLTAQVLDDGDLLHDPTTGLRAVLLLPFAVIVTVAVGVVRTVVAWRGSGAGVSARLHQSFLLAGPAALTWFLAQWNLIGRRF